MWRGNVSKFLTSRWLDGVVPAEMAQNLYKLTKRQKLFVEQAMSNDKWMTGFSRINSKVQLREYTTL
jgi:hypothetical protein